MLTEARLRDAIVAAPHDDGPRLVLADLLLERGDARGQLIRLQCANGPGAEERELRISGLFQAHGAHWRKDELGTASEVELHYADVVWRRGFIDEVRFDGETLADLAPRLARQPIRTLRVRSGVHLALAELTRLPLLRQLTRLELGHGVEHVPAQPLRELLAVAPALEELVLSPAESADPLWEAIVQSPLRGRLRRLSMSKARLGEAQARVLAHELPSLDGLVLDDCLTSETLAVLSSEMPPGLSELEVRNSHPARLRVELRDEALAAALRRPWVEGLERLTLSHCWAEHETVEALASLSCAPRLRELQLDSLRRRELVQPLSTLQLPAIEKLVLSGNQLGDSSAAVLARFSTLKHLELFFNDLRADGARMIIDALPGLEVLELSGTKIGDRGVRAVAWSEHARSLRQLYLRDNALSRDAIEAIVDCGNLSALRVLSLERNPVERDAVALLAAAPFDAMQRLGVEDTMTGSSAPLFADGWVPAGQESWARQLDETGRAVRVKLPRRRREAPPSEVPLIDLAAEYEVGTWVKHPQYGVGKITAAERLKLEVEFDRAGVMSLSRIVAGAQPYETRRRYSVGDLLQHPTLGAGTVVKVSGDRIEVEFGANGTRKLVHAKQ